MTRSTFTRSRNRTARVLLTVTAAYAMSIQTASATALRSEDDRARGPSERIPAFARKYGMTCTVCHSPIPALTAFGEQFAANGFRIASQEPEQDTITTGDNRLSLPRNVPLAIRLDTYVRAFSNGQTATDFETPFNLKILSGNTLSPKLSYYLYFFLFERGEVGGIEDAFIHVNDVADLPLDLAVGQFQISDPMFKRELRLEFDDYAIYRARVGLQPADLTYDRGIMVTGDIGGITITGEVVNGNGRGIAADNRRFDNDVGKVFFGHATRDITRNLRVGVMGFRGRQTGTASDGAASVNNTTWMVGFDGTVAVGPVEVNGQYIYREDNSPLFLQTELDAETKGGFVEAIIRPRRSYWYGVLLYNRVDSSRPLLDVRLGGPTSTTRYETMTAGLGYLLRTNVRLMGEFTWDMEQDATGMTLGLVTAF